MGQTESGQKTLEMRVAELEDKWAKFQAGQVVGGTQAGCVTCFYCINCFLCSYCWACRCATECTGCGSCGGCQVATPQVFPQAGFGYFGR
jgi:hypothetical protein